MKSSYAPPPGPPPGCPHFVDFLFLSPEQIPTLYSQGYARVHLPVDHPLLVAATTLFVTSRDFFATPLHHKEQFRLPQHPEDKEQSSEEGWLRIEGEKELLTIRRSGHFCPPEVTDDTRNLWRECGSFMQTMMRAVEQSLGLESGAFDNVVKAECALPEQDRHATLLRMFRYERTEVPHLVAAHHRDLGLLSLVIGSSPGLDVWDDRTKQWIAIEKDGDDIGQKGLTFTFLVGQTLARLTNNRYKSGVHRVFVPPVDPPCSTDDAKHRYSLVFALRPYKEAIISTSSLTSEVTGDFKYPLEGVKAQALSSAIANAHWNVNGPVAEREAQRLKLQKLKETQVQRPLPRAPYNFTQELDLNSQRRCQTSHQSSRGNPNIFSHLLKLTINRCKRSR